MQADRSRPDRVIAWLLYACLLAAELPLLYLWMFTGFWEWCVGAPGERMVCSSTYQVVVVTAYLFAIIVAAVAVPVGIIRSGRRRWIWPVLAMAWLGATTLAYVGLSTW